MEAHILLDGLSSQDVYFQVKRLWNNKGNYEAGGGVLSRGVWVAVILDESVFKLGMFTHFYFY